MVSGGIKFHVKAVLGAFAVLLAIVVAPVAHAQSPERPVSQILSYTIQGIDGQMAPDQARQVLLGAGFAEKRDGEDWGKTLTGTFTKGEVQVGLSHYEGRILGIVETRIAHGDPYDISGDLASIRQHFNLSGDEGCIVRDHGTRCGIREAGGGKARFAASLTPQMIHIQASAGQ